MPQSIPAGLKKEHVLRTLADLDAGIDHPFGKPTGYELVHDDKRYPDGEKRRLFVRDPSTQFKGYCVPKVYHCISDDPHIARAVRLFSEANKIRCEVKPGEPASLGDVMRMIQLQNTASLLVGKSAVRV